jgi:homoserine O-acetyltransferase
MTGAVIGDVPTVTQPAWGRSVGLVTPQVHVFTAPFVTQSGAVLPSPWHITYETYGTLNADRSNAILLCHALSGDAHAAGRHSPHDTKPGWSEPFIGPGRAVDTERYFVICSNIIGGCAGSTGPASLDPATGQPWGSRFPVLTIRDMVAAQALLLDALGIDRLLAVAGGSVGGMQALEWAASFGDRVRGIIALATTARSSAMTLALNAVGRQAIINDPNWRGGDYYGGPVPASGLATARQIGHISYLSAEALADKFDRRWQEPGGPHWSHAPEFAVESYLAHQGQRFVQRFDANSYLVITRAMDYFDLEQRPGGLAAAFAQTAARFFVASWSTDWLYPPVESVQIAQAAQAAGREVTYYPFESTRGHDAFLLEDEQMTPPLADWLAAVLEG